MLHRCPRCDLFQLRCEDDGCEQCCGNALSLSDAQIIYLPALVAIHLLHLLPLKQEKSTEINSRSFGKILPQDVDFDTFTTHTGKCDS